LVARTLITTADERTWPKNKNEPVLFLGEWCKRYSRKHIWENMDYKMIPYHWDDRKKLFIDYQYIRKIYEELLEELSIKLNQIHSTNHDVRYWRILVGPWLGNFICIVFDRWFMIQSTVNSYSIKECYLLSYIDDLIDVSDMDEFNELLAGDYWNELIYAQLLRESYSDKIKFVNIVHNRPGKKRTQKGLKQRFKSYVVQKILAVYNKILPKDDCLFIISSYLPFWTELKLQFKFGQFPKIWRSEKTIKSSVIIEKRQWDLNVSKNYEQSRGEFNVIIGKLISQHLPTAYLEGYRQLVECTNKLPWPKNPKLIFTSNSYSSDDIFKCWAAEKTEQAVPLIIGQHGGHFGMNTFALHEEHQIKIADKWLSWGWSDIKRAKIVPIGNLKTAGRGAIYNPRGGALMVEMDLQRYSYHLYASPVANQWLDYFKDQQLFLNALPEKLRSKVILRIRDNYGWDQKDRWSSTIPDLEISSSVQDIRKSIKKSRLFISTYNATTYLESFSWNVPTIMFWNPNHWELNEEAKTYFKQLKLVGIFHETPESAAKQMIKIWGDVDGWWKSEEVQNAKDHFCYNYARKLVNAPEELNFFFTDTINQHKNTVGKVN
jgi:putative transferase (TIGR04331 family)